MNEKIYFLGGTSPTGFQSKFSEIINKPDYYTYIIKGGPGTGKSTLMKKIASKFENNDVELYYCSSDTKSLDAVVINDLKIIFVDGTSPHVFDPIYPGACQEIINLGEYWNADKMKTHKESICYCSDENKKCHDRVKRYVRAFSSLNSGIYTIGENCMLTEKLDGFISRFTAKVLPKSKTEKQGLIEYKQLSAITAEGYKTMPLSDDYTVYLLSDDILAASDYFLRKFSANVTAKGYDIILSECTMLLDNTIEHMLIPELKLAFMTSNFFNKVKFDNYNSINFGRFYDKSELTVKKQKLSFDKKVCLELSREASATIQTALEIHDQLEEFYIKSINFRKLNEYSNKLLTKVGKLLTNEE